MAAGRSVGERVRTRTLGLAFLLVLASLIALSVAFYNKAFTKVVTVTLRTDHTGNQLQSQSDVKIRGIIIGEVRKIRSQGDGAELTLALKPGMASLVRTNYVARLLPKTLFGERYVSLIVSGSSAPACDRSEGVRTIRGGDVLCQDTSVAYAQIEDVLNDTLPLLQALRPQDVSATLHALATALQGRGDQLGRNLDQLQQYLTKLNPHLGNLITDIDKLGRVALEYNGVAPDLLATLQNLQTTSATITQKAGGLDALLTQATTASNTLRGFLDDNGDRLITVASQSRQVLALLAEYSPEYPCMSKGLAESEVMLERAFRNNALNITLEIVKPRGKFVPGNEPKHVTGVGPGCFGLPNPTKPFPGKSYPDGAPPLGPGAVSTTGASTQSADQSGIGSRPETQLVNALIAHDLGAKPDDVPAIATLLAAPLLRGGQVTVS